MQAMVINQFGGPEQLVLRDFPTPVPEHGEVLIKVKALGINRAELYMRKGLFGEVTPVSGIECVGQVENDPSGTLRHGQTVATITGGMGRTRNGSYAEYTCVPLQQVFPLQTDLDWVDLAAIPESYATAWSCLFANLRIKSGQVLFVRGGTSALGQAAINIAREEGVTVLTSTRSESKVALLTEFGASRVLLFHALYHTTLSLTFRAFALANMPFGVDVNAFASLLFGTKDFPHSDIPLQKIVDRVANGTYKTRPVKVFPFEQLPDAHRLMESNSANGKIVVVR